MKESWNENDLDEKVCDVNTAIMNEIILTGRWGLHQFTNSPFAGLDATHMPPEQPEGV